MKSEDFEKIINDTKVVVLACIKKYLLQDSFHLIDDVAQETYFRAYKALEKGKFQNRSQLSTYLYTIARNETLRMNDKIRRESEKKNRLTDVIKKNQREELFEQTNLLPDLQEFYQTLLLLPEKYSSVLRLQLAGDSEKSIAGKLNLNPGTVKSRISRAKDALRNIINRRKFS